MTNASIARRIADRSSASVSPMLNPAIGSFQASRAAETTLTATGVSVWPRPQKTPVNPVTSKATEVVSSVPWPTRSDWTFRKITRRPSSPSPIRA